MLSSTQLCYSIIRYKALNNKNTKLKQTFKKSKRKTTKKIVSAEKQEIKSHYGILCNQQPVICKA